MVRWILVGVPSASLVRLFLESRLRPDLIIIQISPIQIRAIATSPLIGLWRGIIYLRGLFLFFCLALLVRGKFELLKTHDINNDQTAHQAISSSQAPLAVVRGGRILAKRTLRRFSGKWVNIHGGILPAYRGLDSHLWAASRQDWGRIGVTAHEMSVEIDKGKALMQIFVKDSQKLNWLKLSHEIKKAENETLLSLVNSWDALANNDSVDVGQGESHYYGRFPRNCLNIPKLKLRRRVQ